ncbi:hypothetical protein [Nocardia sp. NBC_01329]|uniref:hypothetical protein n=1 Tax=Nocardia sp. NBC_01329 TaxID=2903594 RepID=UPI002E164979|nr:hypothetical protein OG405_02630 [Nocardia sp. NBC_01329]
MSEPVRSYWKPGQGMDFGRVTVSADRGRLRDTGEVFASLQHGPNGQDLVQVTVHKESQFTAILQLTMTVDDAIAVLGAVQGVLHDAFDQAGQSPRRAAPVRIDGSGQAA